VAAPGDGAVLTEAFLIVALVGLSFWSLVSGKAGLGAIQYERAKDPVGYWTILALTAGTVALSIVDLFRRTWSAFS